jgi:hypothetical protein
MQGSCSNPTLQILFTPMYSAYIDGTKPFKVPAVVNGVAAGSVTWTASDPSFVDIEVDATLGGAMITTRKSGSVKIIASAGGLCGVSDLTITAASMDDWMIGSSRYNDGVTLTRAPGGRGGLMMSDSGVNTKEAACTNCHGDTATMLRYKTVSHTPQQTGGFSDDDLRNIFLHGMVPAGGYFDEKIVPYQQWSGFHQWQMTSDEEKGIIVYLRSLTPQMQAGSADFGGMRGDGGRRFGDGGRGDGGRMRNDGGDMTGGGSDAAGNPPTSDDGSVSSD